MPRNTVVNAPSGEGVPPPDDEPKDSNFDPEVKDDPKEEPAKVGGCGVRNLHWTGEGKITCTLRAGHDSDHAAPYPGSDKKVMNWSDIAVSGPIPPEIREKLDAEEERKEQQERQSRR